MVAVGADGSSLGTFSNIYRFLRENLRHERLISNVSKENNLRPDKKISYISGLTRPI